MNELNLNDLIGESTTSTTAAIAKSIQALNEARIAIEEAKKAVAKDAAEVEEKIQNLSKYISKSSWAQYHLI